jgi:hypothetical protein
MFPKIPKEIMSDAGSGDAIPRSRTLSVIPPRRSSNDHREPVWPSVFDRAHDGWLSQSIGVVNTWVI